MAACAICGSIVAPPRRKFCGDHCAREKIQRWKQALREQLREESKQHRTIVPPWKDGWKDDEVRKRYFREDCAVVGRQCHREHGAAKLHREGTDVGG